MRSAFSRQMALISALLLITLFLTGGAYRMAMQRYMESQQRETLSSNAGAIAELSRAYGSAGELENSWDFRMSMSLASEVSGADAVICDTSGKILVCTDAFSCEHIGLTVNADWLQTVLEDGAYSATASLPELYAQTRRVQAVRLVSDSGKTLGAVIVSAPAANAAQMGGGVFRVYLYSAVFVFLVALVATYFLSRREIRPIREFSETVRKFGHGELSARIAPDSSRSEEMEELAAAFNSMADTLQSADQRRQDFIANVSHELKTPMTTIAGYMDGMLDGTIPQEAHPRYMRIVADEVRRLSRLVRSMLELSRMQSERLDESKKSRFDLGEALTKVLLSFEQPAEKKHLEVQVDLPEKPIYTLAYQDAVTQVIYNLIDNAVKFCNDCGFLTVGLRREGDKALVTVRNTGPVIPPDELPRIFDRFHKLDKSRSQDPSGVGLGLYIVKTIIGSHGEDIWVESRDGATTFTFTMPAVK